MCIDTKYTFKRSKTERNVLKHRATFTKMYNQKIDKSNNSTQPIKKRYSKRTSKEFSEVKKNKLQYGSASHRTKKITGKIYHQ